VREDATLDTAFYVKDPVLCSLRQRLDAHSAQGLAPLEIFASDHAMCRLCQCAVECHEVVELSDAERQSLSSVRRLFEPLSITAGVTQSVYDTMHLGWSRDKFTYGEVNLLAFMRFLEKLRHRLYTGVFYDLGCGLGRAVFVAAMHPTVRFTRCIGVELLPGICKVASLLSHLYQRELCIDTLDSCIFHHAPVEFQNLDLMQATLNDATFVYIASTCFDANMMIQLGMKLAKELLPGRLVCTLRNPLPNSGGGQNDGFELLETIQMPMSWGMADVFVHQRRHSAQITHESVTIDLECMD